MIDQYNIFCCHNNVRLNEDSEPLRITSNALCVTVNLIDVHGGQSACEDNLDPSSARQVLQFCEYLIGLVNCLGSTYNT